MSQVIVHRGRQIQEALAAAGLVGAQLEETAHQLYQDVSVNGECIWWGDEPIRFTHPLWDAYRQLPPIRRIPWVSYTKCSVLGLNQSMGGETYLEYDIEAEPSLPILQQHAVAERRIARQLVARHSDDRV